MLYMAAFGMLFWMSQPNTEMTSLVNRQQVGEPVKHQATKELTISN